MAQYVPPAQVGRLMNPLLQRYLGRDINSMASATQRHLHTVEGYMRYRQGQIGFEQMNSHGTLLVPMTLGVGLPAGAIISLNDDDTSTHSPDPIGHNQDSVSLYSSLGQHEREFSGRSGGGTISVANREAIETDTTYMWSLDSRHIRVDICDSFQGRVYKGYEVPALPHPNCRCKLIKLEDTNTIRTPRSQSNFGSTIAQGVGIVGAIATGFKAADSLLQLTGANENAVWRNTMRFVSTVNSVNSTIVKALNPMNLVTDLASDVLKDVKKQSMGYVKNQAQQAILAQINDPQLKRMANAYLQGQLNATAMAQLQSMNPQAARTLQLLDTANHVSNRLGNASSLSDMMGILEESRPLAKAAGAGEAFGKVLDSPVFNMTKTKAVLLEDGLKGLVKVFMILR